MVQARFASGRLATPASVCLLIFALSSAMARAQNKNVSSGTDPSRASTQPRDSEIKTPRGVPAGSVGAPARSVAAPAGSAANSDLPCAQQSIVSELGCSQERPTSSPQPSGAEGQATPPGAFERLALPKNFWSNELGLEAGRAARTYCYGQSDSPDVKRLSEQADDPMASVASLTLETSYRASFPGMKGAPGQTLTVYRYLIPLSIQGVSST